MISSSCKSCRPALPVRGSFSPSKQAINWSSLGSSGDCALPQVESIASESGKHRFACQGNSKCDSPAFNVPSSWQWCRLRLLATTLGDELHGTPEYSDNGDCYFINGN